MYYTEALTIRRRKKNHNPLVERERGVIRKDPGGRLRVALVYPNTYHIAMSNLGFQTLYGIFNNRADTLAERFFLPEKVELRRIKEGGAQKKLRSLETSALLEDFDLLAFSISFEEDYINVLKILNLSGFPLYSKDRAEDFPLVMAGGCAPTLNPEPVADFLDFFFIGEAEAGLSPLIQALSFEGKKEEVLTEVSKVEGLYVPSFYELKYSGAKIESFSVKERYSKVATYPVKRVQADLDKIPLATTQVLTPDTEFSDTTLIEIERGCPRGCRFCTAGFIYLPPRLGDTSKVEEAIESATAGGSGETKVGLVGAAVSEHPDIEKIIKNAIEKDVIVTLSSLRLDMLDPEFLALLKEAGYRTITIAPEAASERLRRVINKEFKDCEIIEKVQLIKESGFKRVKLYFMVGLPTETDSDAGDIVELVKKIRDELKGGQVIVSVNPFIPKAKTPFQWCSLENTDTLERRYGILKDGLKREGGIELKLYPLKDAPVQALLALGDRRISPLLLLASEIGWKRALRKSKVDILDLIGTERTSDELLPFDIIDTGIKKDYLWREYQRGLEAKITPPCVVESCIRCGVC